MSFYLLCDRFRPAYCVGCGFLRLLERLVKFSHGRLDQDSHFVRIKVNALLLKQRLSSFQSLIQLVRAVDRGLYLLHSLHSHTGNGAFGFIGQGSGCNLLHSIAPASRRLRTG